MMTLSCFAPLRSVGDGVAQTQLNTLKEILNDIGESVGDDNHFKNSLLFNQKFIVRALCQTKKV